MARISCKTPCRAKIRHDDENLQTAAEGSCGRCKGRRRSGWDRGRVTATRLAPRPSRGGAAKLRWRFRSPHRDQGSGERAVGRKAVSQLGGRRAVEGGGTPPFEACSSPGASTVTRPVTRGRRLREGNGTVRGLRGALGGSRGFESLSAHLTRGCARGCVLGALGRKGAIAPLLRARAARERVQAAVQLTQPGRDDKGEEMAHSSAQSASEGPSGAANLPELQCYALGHNSDSHPLRRRSAGWSPESTCGRSRRA